jgi:hypothetical protein
MPKQDLRLAVATGIAVAVSHASSTAARADGPQVSVAGIVGGASANDYGLGLGVRGGYKLEGESAFYIGGRILEHFGTSVQDATSTLATNYQFAFAEPGWEWTFGAFGVRPQLGFGAAHISATASPSPNGGSSFTRDTLDFTIAPGIVATYTVARRFFIGVDLNVTKIFVTGDDTTFIGFYGELGAKF